MNGRRAIILSAAAVVLLAGAGAALGPWTRADEPAGADRTEAATVPTRPAQTPQPQQQQQRADLLIAQRTKGDSAAPLTLYEVGDFQCSACRLFFEETLPHIVTEYVETGKLRLVFVNFPIMQIHPNAAAAHELAMCAARQDRFWPVHDLLYSSQEAWAPLSNPQAYFMELAGSAGLDREILTTCLNRGETRALVLTEAQSAFQAGVRSTPSFIIEGALVSGAAPIDAWRPILDSIYTAKTGGS